MTETAMTETVTPATMRLAPGQPPAPGLWRLPRPTGPARTHIPGQTHTRATGPRCRPLSPRAHQTERHSGRPPCSFTT